MLLLFQSVSSATLCADDVCGYENKLPRDQCFVSLALPIEAVTIVLCKVNLNLDNYLK